MSRSETPKTGRQTTTVISLGTRHRPLGVSIRSAVDAPDFVTLTLTLDQELLARALVPWAVLRTALAVEQARKDVDDNAGQRPT